MKIANPVKDRHARIEVVPLIDIMFFLLAAFVLVSLTMVKQLTVEVDLPAAHAAAQAADKEPIALAVDRDGAVFFGHDPVELDELRARLAEQLKDNPKLPVSIAGDRETTHGAMVAVLQYVRACGAENVGFALQNLDAAAAGPVPVRPAEGNSAGSASPTENSAPGISTSNANPGEGQP